MVGASDAVAAAPEHGSRPRRRSSSRPLHHDRVDRDGNLQHADLNLVRVLHGNTDVSPVWPRRGSAPQGRFRRKRPHRRCRIPAVDRHVVRLESVLRCPVGRVGRRSHHGKCSAGQPATSLSRIGHVQLGAELVGDKLHRRGDASLHHERHNTNIVVAHPARAVCGRDEPDAQGASLQAWMGSE